MNFLGCLSPGGASKGPDDFHYALLEDPDGDFLTGEGEDRDAVRQVTKSPIKNTYQIVQIVFGYWFDDFPLSVYEEEKETGRCLVFHDPLASLMEPDKISFLRRPVKGPRSGS